jgi:hypothetical protein
MVASRMRLSGPWLVAPTPEFSDAIRPRRLNFLAAPLDFILGQFAWNFVGHSRIVGMPSSG